MPLAFFMWLPCLYISLKPGEIKQQGERLVTRLPRLSGITSVEGSDADISPGDIVRSLPPWNAVHLQTDEPLGMRLVNFVVCQIGDLMAVDPGLNMVPFGDNPVFVPLAILEVFMGNQFILVGQPTSSGRLSVDVAGFGAVGATGFDFYLRTVDTPVLRTTFGLFCF